MGWVHEIAQDVNLGAGHVCVDLDPCDHLDAVGPARGLRFADAFGGVVIGHGHDLQRQPRHAGDELRRR